MIEVGQVPDTATTPPANVRAEADLCGHREVSRYPFGHESARVLKVSVPRGLGNLCGAGYRRGHRQTDPSEKACREGFGSNMRFRPIRHKFLRIE